MRSRFICVAVLLCVTHSVAVLGSWALATYEAGERSEAEYTRMTRLVVTQQNLLRRHGIETPDLGSP